MIIFHKLASTWKPVPSSTIETDLYFTFAKRVVVVSSFHASAFGPSSVPLIAPSREIFAKDLNMRLMSRFSKTIQRFHSNLPKMVGYLAFELPL